jgi:hypothetical protein
LKQVKLVADMGDVPLVFKINPEGICPSGLDGR